jgi:multidrug transporter EmrE-like cation transporter
MLLVASIILISIIEFIGDSNFKIFARTNDYTSLVIGSVAYIVMVAFLVIALRLSNVIYVNGMWDGVSALIESLLAYLVLKETLSNNYQYAGLGLVIAGIFFLNFGKIPA